VHCIIILIQTKKHSVTPNFRQADVSIFVQKGIFLGHNIKPQPSYCKRKMTLNFDLSQK